MAILVTGGAGYVGSHMAHALVDRGEDVVVIDDLSTGHRELIPEQAKLVEGDIADRKLVSKLIADENINAIAHFAGSIVVSDSVSDPLTYYENNTVKSRALIETAVAAKIEAFLFSSTAAVYGEPGVDLLDEEQNLQPVSPYGWSKLMTEVMLRDSAGCTAPGVHVLTNVGLISLKLFAYDPLQEIVQVGMVTQVTDENGELMRHVFNPIE